jgi:hypothetical protein
VHFEPDPNFDIDPDPDPEAVTLAGRRDYAAINFEFQKGTSPYLSAAIVNDTTRWREFGAYHGRRIHLEVASAPMTWGDLGSYTQYALDLRTYQKMTRRSLIAWRLAGDVRQGDGATLHGIGGYNQLRGFRFREFIGDRAVYTNLEIRYPLIDELRLPFGSIRQIRGLAFIDAGTAWTQDGLFYDRSYGLFRDFKLYDKTQNRLQDGRVSYGTGFSFRLGYFELFWTFAKRLPYGETHISGKCRALISTAADLEAYANAISTCPIEVQKDSGFRSDFYIGIPF